MNTPNSKRPVLAKILASVAILTLAFCAFTIPTQAYNFGNGIPNVVYASPYSPDAISYSIGLSSREYNVLLGLDFVNAVNYQTNPANSSLTYQPIGWSCNFSLNRTLDQTADYDIYYGDLVCTPNSVSQGSATLDVTYFYWSDFTYNDEWSAFIPEIALNYSDDTYVRYDYTVRFTEVGGDGTITERNGTIIIDNDGSYHIAPDIRSIINRATGSLGGNYYIAELVLGCIPTYDFEGTSNNVDVLFTDARISSRYYDPDHLIGDFWHAPPDTEVIYQQIVNSGDASDFLGAMSNWVSNFFSTVLFRFGSVPITPGAILSVGAGLALTIWILKLFMGG